MAPYSNIWPVIGAFDIPLICNAEAFDALPADLQVALVEASREMGRQVFFGWEADRKAIELTLSHFGYEFVIPSDAEVDKATAATTSVVDWWVGIAGPYAQEVLDISRKYGSGAR